MCDGCRSKCQCLLLLSDLPLGALPETGQTEAVEQKNGEKAVSLKLDVVCLLCATWYCMVQSPD